MDTKPANMEMRRATIDAATQTIQGAINALRGLLEIGIRTPDIHKAVTDLERQQSEMEYHASMVSNPILDKRLDPVPGDILPPVGRQVFIDLASSSQRQAVTVVGYYVWPGLQGQGPRVFVRVKDDQGFENARLLEDVFAEAEKKAVA